MKKITFKAVQKKYETLERMPIPASKKLPDWFKNINIYVIFKPKKDTR